MRLDRASNVWRHFATMPYWSPRCIGVNNSALERSCGRALGLKFDPISGELYVADAYHGLVVVGREGGQGVSVATSAEGIPFGFTNSTGRLISYNPQNQAVRVLRRNLPFPNGVALSRNMDYALITETTTRRIYRFWFKGPRYHTSDLFMVVGGRPDNINRAPDANFWIAQVPLPYGASQNGGMPIKVNEQAQVLERLDYAIVTSASDVKEFGGTVWIGNVIHPFIQVASP